MLDPQFVAPSRERGLKPASATDEGWMTASRSLAGARIETLSTRAGRAGWWSLPSRERGSKPCHNRLDDLGESVAPFTGAWIETRMLVARSSRCRPVAPFTGAWIETVTASRHAVSSTGRPLRGGVDRNTSRSDRQAQSMRSPPSRGRGSKRAIDACRRCACTVAPFTGAWIETSSTSSATCEHVGVAPFTGAWIETAAEHAAADRRRRSPPSRGRGSKQLTDASSTEHVRVAPSRGRGSKHRDRPMTRRR